MAYRHQGNNGYGSNDREMDMRTRGSDRNDGIDKQNTHLIEHLATFTVTRETGIIYPSDGMNRLLQLEQSNGIWSQKMQLCLDHQWVLIMDYETGSEMERFPANSIEEPTAFTNQDPMAMYNNMLVFIVTNSNPQQAPEMHIFQCQSISAQDLAEDLKQLRLGRTLSRIHKSSIPPTTYRPPQNIINPSRDHHRDYHGSDSELTANNDDSSSTTSEKYERDVTILNHCFDDIEKFIARLQHAAAAARELERRRKSRKTKKRDMGDGMLTMRTKPPPEKEFVDIFQKFKLSFNLLAKLKAHIHDPNAPELVHFLFTPLALIVEASNDTYFDQHIPHNVIAPLLTREAINLLMNCVTSKETELWHSLGTAWLMPRDQYKGHVPPYHPTFLDGWSPEYPIIDEIDSNMEKQGYGDPLDNAYNNDYDYQSSSQEIFERNPNDRHPPENQQTIGDSTRSDISVDSIETKGVEERAYGSRSNDSFLDDLLARGANVVHVTYPRTANNDKELTVTRGEYLEILDDSRKWWKARNSRGQVAHVPHTIVTPYHPPVSHYQHTGKNIQRPESPNHMPSKNSNDWMNERVGKKVLPHAQLRNHQRPVPDTSKPSSSGAPPPPPPPMPDPNINYGTLKKPSLAQSHKEESPKETGPSAAEFRRDPSRQSFISNDDDLHNELHTELINNVKERKGGRKRMIDINKTPEIYINEKSKPKEVQDWLKQKGFDSKTSATLKDLNGQNLFDFTKEELIKLFGAKEGGRLDSQLKVQKSISRYTSVSVIELQAFLAKARSKIEKKDAEKARKVMSEPEDANDDESFTDSS